MHPLFKKASGLTEGVIAAAIEVHRDKGPGLIESIYEWCLTKEFELRGLSCSSQKIVVITYKSITREEPLRWSRIVFWWKQKPQRKFCPSTKPNSSAT
jgi:hypothetical protein